MENYKTLKFPFKADQTCITSVSLKSFEVIMKSSDK